MGTSGKTGPSRAWYLLPSLMVLAAVILAGFGIASFARFVGSDFHDYQPDSAISVTREGFTVYAENGTTGPADLRCTVEGPEATVQLPRVSGRTTLTNGQGTFLAIASTPRDLPTGRYVLSCVSHRSGADVQQLFVGPRVDLTAVGRLVALAIIAPLFLGVCSIVLFAIVAILRYRAHRTAISTG